MELFIASPIPFVLASIAGSLTRWLIVRPPFVKGFCEFIASILISIYFTPSAGSFIKNWIPNFPEINSAFGHFAVAYFGIVIIGWCGDFITNYLAKQNK
jgi:hypothetical protein